MLTIQALSFDYLDNPILNQVQFSLNAGSLLHLTGVNGAGKTTLLRLLAGILQPISGEILWQGVPIHEDLPAYQRVICYVGHKLGISPGLTVVENCFFDARWQGASRIFARQLSRFALTGLADVPCKELSEGQRRRVALMRLGMSRAKLWLLDEPWVALDEPARQALACMIQEHLAEEGMVIMTSHQRLPECLLDGCMSYALSAHDQPCEELS